MSTQNRIQKKPQANASTLDSPNKFESRGFSVQTKSDSQQSDLKTQLKQAKRFGHNFSQVSTHESSPSVTALQTKAPAKGESAQSSTSNHSSQNASSSRNSLAAPVRSKMENSFGTSFSDVNIHTDSHQAKGIGALAFTQGNNIHFAPGQYNPQNPSGQALLGHELTHVVQQRAGRVPVPHQSKGAPINADSALETEADNMGAKAAQGQQVQIPGLSNNNSSATTAPPIQNSTQPVQCFLPLLGAALPMLGGLLGGGGGAGGHGGGGGMMGMMGNALGGALSGGLSGGLGGAVMGGLGGLLGGGGGGGQKEE
ncbi:eCIS core domain-containing protein [Nostoc sp.]